MDDEMTIKPLGSGRSVGRSCVVLKFKGSTVMFDCGVHPAHSGMAALPVKGLLPPPARWVFFFFYNSLGGNLHPGGEVRTTRSCRGRRGGGCPTGSGETFTLAATTTLPNTDASSW